jgi:glycosyltransferase involved in cell wall biosynthesis
MGAPFRSVSGMTRPFVNCAMLTQGRWVPSTRYRVMQFLDRLPAYGVRPSLLDARFGAYPPASLLERPGWGIGAVANGLWRSLQARRLDVTLVQRSLISSMRTFECLSARPLILDVDDAIFLQGWSGWHDALARRATHVICGNEYLAEHYRRLAPVSVIPTTVDTQKFVRSPNPPENPVIGWSGTSSGLTFLYSIEIPLGVVLKRFPSAKLKIVCDRPPRFASLPADRVIFEQWTPEREVTGLQSFTVGLMPLVDTSWSRGKCAFKMLTFMAVGIPVVVSPIGPNKEILELGHAGFAASKDEDWVEALSRLLHDPALSMEMGSKGRSIVEQHFDCEVHAPVLADVIKQAAQH